MEYLLLLAHTLKSIITYVISWIKNSGLGNWSDIVTILTFILILIPLIKRWGKHTSFLLPNISCVIEENGEKISFIINIQKYSSDLFYGEFTLTIKQIGGAPQGLTVLETYPSYGPEIIRIENGYSKSYSKRFTFRRVGVVESNLEIRVSGDIGNDIIKTHTLVIEKNLINKLLQQTGSIKLKRKWYTCLGMKRIKYKI